MKYLVRLTGRSLRDMEAIYIYVEADASQHAFAWFNRLAKQFIVWSTLVQIRIWNCEEEKAEHLIA